MITDTLRLVDTVYKIDTLFRDAIPILLKNEPIKTTFDYIKDFVPILTLLLGALLGFGIQRFNDWLKFLKTKKYFFFSLKQLIQGVNHQIKVYEDYLKVYETHANYIPDLAFNMYFNTNSIYVVSKQDMFKIIVSKQQDELNMDILVNRLNYIDMINRGSDKSNATIFKHYLETNSQLRDLMEKLFSEINEYDKNCSDNCLVDVNGLETKIPELTNKFKSTVKLGVDTSFHKIYNELIVPLNNMIVESKRTELFYPSLNAIINLYAQYSNTRQGFIDIRTKELEQIKLTEIALYVILNNYSEARKKFDKKGNLKPTKVK